MIFSIVHLKTFIFGRPKQRKNSSKILANTFSDSLAIFKKKMPYDVGNFFHRKIPGSLSVPTTLSRTLVDSLSIPFPFLLQGTHIRDIVIVIALVSTKQLQPKHGK